MLLWNRVKIENDPPERRRVVLIERVGASGCRNLMGRAVLRGERPGDALHVAPLLDPVLGLRRATQVLGGGVLAILGLVAVLHGLDGGGRGGGAQLTDLVDEPAEDLPVLFLGQTGHAALEATVSAGTLEGEVPLLEEPGPRLRLDRIQPGADDEAQLAGHVVQQAGRPEVERLGLLLGGARRRHEQFVQRLVERAALVVHVGDGRVERDERDAHVAVPLPVLRRALLAPPLLELRHDVDAEIQARL